MTSNLAKQLGSHGSGQSISDRLTSFKHSMSGSLVAKAICKATTEELIAPKRKHLDVLVRFTREPRLSISDFCKFLLDRLRSPNWIVVFKCLITIHHLMHYGSDQFSQFLATNYSQISANKFAERTNATTFSYILKYASYLQERSRSIGQAGFDFCKLKRGTSEIADNQTVTSSYTGSIHLKNYDSFAPLIEDENLRSMHLNKLMKTLPILGKLLDALTEVKAPSREICGNPVMQASYLLLYIDMIRLYAVYNEGMINLIERYFSMPKKQCQDALEFYKEYLKKMDVMGAFVKTAEEVTAQSHDSDSMLFRKVPHSVLEALEIHVAQMDDRKSGLKAINGPSPASMNLIDTTNSIWDQPVTPTPAMKGNLKVSEDELKNILDEERRRLDSYIKNARSHVEQREQLSISQEIIQAQDSTLASGSGTIVDLFSQSSIPSQNISSLDSADSWNNFLSISDNLSNTKANIVSTNVQNADLFSINFDSTLLMSPPAASSNSPNANFSLSPNPMPISTSTSNPFSPQISSFPSNGTTLTVKQDLAPIPVSDVGNPWANYSTSFYPATSNGSSTQVTPRAATVDEKLAELANMSLLDHGSSTSIKPAVNWAGKAPVASSTFTGFQSQPQVPIGPLVFEQQTPSTNPWMVSQQPIYSNAQPIGSSMNTNPFMNQASYGANNVMSNPLGSQNPFL